MKLSPRSNIRGHLDVCGIEIRGDFFRNWVLGSQLQDAFMTILKVEFRYMNVLVFLVLSKIEHPVGVVIPAMLSHGCGE